MSTSFMESLKSKLSSRKFWTMIIGVVVCGLTYNGMDADSIQKVSSILGIAGSVIAYMCVEGGIDKAKLLKYAEDVVEVATNKDINDDGVIGENPEDNVEK